ncbi:hypothetical protein [Baaleninema simplex]|uniref:hypothetical protein n=1 Tax=Baaleninema simplex TaxID=2862350 RepID=UPI0008FC14F6|nr:hypothetical protein [Baaleninema simplex]
MPRLYLGMRYLAWAWLIVLGGLIIPPTGVIACTICSNLAAFIVGILTMVLGAAGLVTEIRGLHPMRPEH